jgi:hypothetical protein
MDDKEIIRKARNALKKEMVNGNIWPGTRCACGKYGATDLAHIVYTRHPDHPSLYSKLNCAMYCNSCNTTQERLWINVNACLILIQRAGGITEWITWARSLPRKSAFHIPQKMNIAMDLWEGGVYPFQFEKIKAHFGPRKEDK